MKQTLFLISIFLTLNLFGQELNEKVLFNFVDGGSGEMNRSDILLHIVNHQTFHRGHLSDMLYQSGYEPPSIDLPVFHRNVFSKMNR